MSNQTIIQTADGHVLSVCWCEFCRDMREPLDEEPAGDTYAFERFWEEHSAACRCAPCLALAEDWLMRAATLADDNYV